MKKTRIWRQIRKILRRMQPTSAISRFKFSSLKHPEMRSNIWSKLRRAEKNAYKPILSVPRKTRSWKRILNSLYRKPRTNWTPRKFLTKLKRRNRNLEKKIMFNRDENEKQNNYDIKIYNEIFPKIFVKLILNAIFMLIYHNHLVI